MLKWIVIKLVEKDFFKKIDYFEDYPGYQLPVQSGIVEWKITDGTTCVLVVRICRYVLVR
ncbi:MAG: hypothetical protein SCALA701_32390 [Candidatus Scalindua sp.]|nr:MAG: hypothetical protein SCALA701_32390 [Candidatus Scalindua sp.]